MLKIINQRNKRVKEDIEDLHSQGYSYVNVLRMVSFKYGLLETTVDKMYLKMCKEDNKENLFNESSDKLSSAN